MHVCLFIYLFIYLFMLSQTPEVPVKPKARRLVALQYNYSDSEDEETREERKARIVSTNSFLKSPHPLSYWEGYYSHCIQGGAARPGVQTHFSNLPLSSMEGDYSNHTNMQGFLLRAT